jgi:hypothetical protein
MTFAKGDTVQRRGEERSIDPKGRVTVIFRGKVGVSFSGLEPIWCDPADLVKVS